MELIEWGELLVFFGLGDYVNGCGMFLGRK